MKKILIVLFLSLSLTACMASSGWAGGMDDFKAGNTALASKDYDKAIQFYTKAIESGELSRDYKAYAHVNRGWAWSRKGDYDRAIADYTKAIEQKHAYARAYYERACTYALKGDKDRALSDLEKAISLDKDIEVYAREELKNIWDEYFRKLTKGNLTQIQEEVRQVVRDRLAEKERSPSNVNKIRLSQFKVRFSQSEPNRVYLYTEEWHFFTDELHIDLVKALCCAVAAEYHKRTGFFKTSCYITYRVMLDFYKYGFEFDGSDCRLCDF